MPQLYLLKKCLSLDYKTAFNCLFKRLFKRLFNYLFNKLLTNIMFIKMLINYFADVGISSIITYICSNTDLEFNK